MQCYTSVVTCTWMPLKLVPRSSSGRAHPSFSVLVLLGMRRCKHDETSRGSSLTTTPILILHYIIEASTLYYSIKRTLPNNIVWEVYINPPHIHAPHGINLSLLNLFGMCLYMGRIIYVLLKNNWTGLISHSLMESSHTLNFREFMSLKKDVIGSEFHQINLITGAPHGINLSC